MSSILLVKQRMSEISASTHTSSTKCLCAAHKLAREERSQGFLLSGFAAGEPYSGLVAGGQSKDKERILISWHICVMMEVIHERERNE